MEIKIFDIAAIAALPDGRSIGVDNHELIAHDQSVPLPTVRALIAAWDRAQGALPELPPGYRLHHCNDEIKLLIAPNGAQARFDECSEATSAAWSHFAATLDPKWAQLLRNAGLPV